MLSKTARDMKHESLRRGCEMRDVAAEMPWVSSDRITDEGQSFELTWCPIASVKTKSHFVSLGQLIGDSNRLTHLHCAASQSHVGQVVTFVFTKRKIG